MSDAAVASIVTGLVTMTTMIVGFLTMWLKLRYGAEKAAEAAVKAGVLEAKVDHNTSLTTDVKEAASAAANHAATCDEQREKIVKMLDDHDGRIASLEMQIAAMNVSMGAVSRNVDSTRHEIRGHLQTLMSKIDIMGTTIPKNNAAPPAG